MALQRLRCEWTGTGIEGPGLTTFYAAADGTQAVSVGASAFFNAIRNFVPSGTTVQVPAQGDVIDEASGALIDTWGSGPTDTVAMAGSGAFAAGVGARVVWETAAIRGGRRVRGSTFVVPLVTGSYETNGTIILATITGLLTAIDNYLVQLGGNGRIWSRPRPGLAGAQVPISRGLVPDKVSWLRSRRV